MKKFKDYIKEQNLNQDENTLDPDFLEAKAKKDERYVQKNIDSEIEDVDQESKSPEHMTEMNNLVGMKNSQPSNNIDIESAIKEFSEKYANKTAPAYRSGSRGVLSSPEMSEAQPDISNLVQKLNQMKNKSQQDMFIQNLMATDQNDNPFQQYMK